MSRRRIAIRRGVVLTLAVVATLIFTAFFRESQGGVLHNLKGAITSLVSPVQGVAVSAVRPVRDGWNWFSELRTARDERNRLRDEVERLRSELAARTVDQGRLDELTKILGVASERPTGYRAVTANVLSRPLVAVGRQARIDKGRDEGVTVNSLVFVPRSRGETSNFGALIGKVDRVDAHSAEVTYITDPSSSIAATTLLSQSKLGLLKANASGDLVLTGVPADKAIAEQDIVVTLGAGTNNFPSPYPPGLAIGFVSSVGRAEAGGVQTVQVTPFGDPNALETVVVFTPRSADAKRRAGVQ